MTKQVFINAIEAIRIQMANDKAYSYALGELLKSDVQLYDNSKLIKSIIELLHLSFPRDEDGFSDIEFYCFESDFGKVGYDEFLSSEGLWDRLTMSHKFNPAPYENLGRVRQESIRDRLDMMNEILERNLMFNPSAGVNINERGHIDLTNPKTSLPMETINKISPILKVQHENIFVENELFVVPNHEYRVNDTFYTENTKHDEQLAWIIVDIISETEIKAVPFLFYGWDYLPKGKFNLYRMKTREEFNKDAKLV